MKADIIAIGTELLLSEVTDTNSAYLASHLPTLGIELQQISVVGDELLRLTDVLEQAGRRSDLVVTTGGLGPTQDDLTREAIAGVLDEELQVSPELEQHIRAMFASIGREMPPANIKQATLIPSAKSLPNPRGTAPGWWVEKGGKLIIALPGPPAEMKRMWEIGVLPEIKRRQGRELVLLRTLKCYGLSEAEVDQLVSPFFTRGNPAVGVYSKPDGIHVRIIAREEVGGNTERMVAEGENGVRAALGERIWGTDDDTLEGVVGRLMGQLGLTVATMESCTGGLLGSTLTDVAGSSAYYRGGLISYSDEAKVGAGVDARVLEEYGSVSGEAAIAMAKVVRNKLEADIGIGITGVAGPDRLEGKPPGLVYIGLADQSGHFSSEGRYPPKREEVKRRAVTQALFLLRDRLLRVSCQR